MASTDVMTTDSQTSPDSLRSAARTCAHEADKVTEHMESGCEHDDHLSQECKMRKTRRGGRRHKRFVRSLRHRGGEFRKQYSIEDAEGEVNPQGVISGHVRSHGAPGTAESSMKDHSAPRP